MQLSPAMVAWEGYEADMAEVYAAMLDNPVMSIGRHVDRAPLGPVPSNVELHGWVPQLAVLGRATVFVTHASMGGCSEGLYQGVPMVAVPQAADQFGNAAMLEELGVGMHLPMPQATPEALRDVILRLAARRR